MDDSDKWFMMAWIQGWIAGNAGLQLHETVPVFVEELGVTAEEVEKLCAKMIKEHEPQK